MRKKLRWLILFLAVGGVYFMGRDMGEKTEEEAMLRKLQVGETVVKVEIADNQTAWERGLSGRDRLAEDRGMLFVYPSFRRLSFWMKEMKFPLDMIVIHNMRVVEIHRDIRNPKEGEDGRKIGVRTEAEAEMLLEVNAGWAKRHGLEPGDEARLLE